MAQASPKEKTPAEQLVKETAESFHTYVGKGVNVPEIGDEATDPNLNIDGLQSLLRIHFVLTGSGQEFTGEQKDPTVVQFMKALPDRIRNLQRSTYQQSQLVKGGIQGNVDWTETIEMYANRGYVDKSRFVCTQPQTEYDTAENRVLTRLLTELKSVFETELETAVQEPENYKWLEEWVAEHGLLDVLEESLTQNIYLQSIEPPERIAQRELTPVKNSRRALYREAAKLLEQYYNLQNRNLDRDEARDILTNVYIRPDTDKGGRLFELYWTFKLLEQFPQHQLQMVKSGTDLIASCPVGDERFELYHHSTGPDKLKFRAEIDEVDEELDALESHSSGMSYFERCYAVNRDVRAYSKAALHSERRSTLWSGVPDILLIRYDANDNISGVTIGECKYTRNMQEIKNGMAELLEYLYYGKIDGEYLNKPTSSGELSSGPIFVEGCLFVDQLPEGVTASSIPLSLVEYDSEYEIPWIN